MNKEAVQHERGPRSSTIRKQMAAIINENLLGNSSALHPSAVYLTQHNLFQHQQAVQQAVAAASIHQQTSPHSPFTSVSSTGSNSLPLFNPLATGNNSPLMPLQFDNNHSTTNSSAANSSLLLNNLNNLNNLNSINNQFTQPQTTSTSSTTLHNSSSHLSAKDLLSNPASFNSIFSNPWINTPSQLTAHNAQQMEESFNNLIANQQWFNLIQMTKAAAANQSTINPYHNFMNLSTSPLLPGMLFQQSQQSSSRNSLINNSSPSNQTNNNSSTDLALNNFNTSSLFANTLHNNLTNNNSSTNLTHTQNLPHSTSSTFSLSNLLSNHSIANLSSSTNQINSNINNSNNSSTSNSSNGSTSLSSSALKQDTRKQLDNTVFLQNLSSLTNANICCPTPKYPHTNNLGMLNICN